MNQKTFLFIMRIQYAASAVVQEIPVKNFPKNNGMECVHEDIGMAKRYGISVFYITTLVTYH